MGTDEEQRIPVSDTPPSMPMWVKVLLITAVLVLAVFVAIAIAGGDHGPGRHA